MLQDRFYTGGKTRNIAIQIVLQQRCKTSCTFFAARFFVPLLICWIVLLDTTFASANEFSEELKISHLLILRLTFVFFSSLVSIQREEHIKTKMANTKQFLSVPLTRKYGSMPLLVPQKSVISLEYKEKGSIPRRGTFGGSEALKTRNIEHDVKEIREVKPVTRLPETFIAKPVQSSISYRREIAYRSPLLERRQSMGAMKTTTLEKKAPGTSQPRLQENKKVKESRQSERLSETSALHDRHNGVNVINVKANTRVQTHEQGNSFYKRQETRGVKSKKKQLSRKRDIPDKTAITRKNDGKSSEVVSLERESHFQDYRQKCVQWLKSLPDTEMPQPTTLR